MEYTPASTGAVPLLPDVEALAGVPKPKPKSGVFKRRASLSLIVVKMVKHAHDGHESRTGISPERQHSIASDGGALPPVDFVSGSKRMICGNKLYWLLLVVPLAMASPAIGLSNGICFTLSCIAILPLAGLLGDVTEQVALHTNETLSGLLNATFGNATEVIVSYFALTRGMLTVVQVSLLGSVLSNTLLVLGCAFLAGGLTAKGSDPTFNKVAAVSNSTLLQIAILGLMVPTLLEGVGAMELHGTTDLLLSRGISCLLLVLYVLYCYFQLFSHRHLFEAEDDEKGDDEEEEAMLPFSGGIAWLAFTTVLIAILSETLTGALEGAAEQWGLTKAFVGFVILPIVGNAAEHSTAVVMAVKGKMDLALGVALGSSTQIALFVVPLMVLLGAAVDQPMDLYFGTFETVTTLLTSLVVFFVVQNGQTNWLEGTMLLFSYFIICFAFYFYEPVVSTKM